LEDEQLCGVFFATGVGYPYFLAHKLCFLCRRESSVEFTIHEAEFRQQGSVSKQNLGTRRKTVFSAFFGRLAYVCIFTASFCIKTTLQTPQMQDRASRMGLSGLQGSKLAAGMPISGL
jgi:hypothetical protein